jgi:hypothetical protein
MLPPTNHRRSTASEDCRLPLLLAIARAVRIRRQLDAALSRGSLPAEQLQALAQLNLWHLYKQAARSIARFPHLDALLRTRGWI